MAAETTTTTSTRQTRAATGNSKPRVFPKIEEVVTKKKSTKANTSKPRVNKTGAGRVAKPTKHKKSPAARAKEVAKGVVEKVEGAVERKPGKKVSFLRVRAALRPSIIT